MQSGDDEIKEIFLSEAFEQTEELNKLFTHLEKNHTNKQAIEAIFRITHTLKANAAGMGLEDIAAIAHVLEDIFNEIKTDNITLNQDLFNDLFKANDILCALINQVKTPGLPVKFRGIKTKLEVRVKKLKDEASENNLQDAAHTSQAQLNKDYKKPVLKRKSPSKAQLEKASRLTKTILTDAKTGIDMIHAIQALAPSETTDPNPEESIEKEAAKNKPADDTKIVISENIHIPVRKLDNLLNLVGELIIEKDRVIALNGEHGKGRLNEYTRLQRITSELQFSVMDIRLVQVNVLFNKFHRIVRDVAAIENKKVNLLLEGTENEIDRNILQIISDSLVHLVRNAISHGIEPKEQRIRQGKGEHGTLKLSAKSEKNEVIIEITDDGQGIDPKRIAKKAIEKGLLTKENASLMSDEDIIYLIFEPGFSSAEKITAISGRGVGMDVVKKAIDSIGGTVSIDSQTGAGTTITLRLPSSMAMKGALLFELESGAFAIPLSYTKAVIAISKKEIHQIGNNLMTTHLDKNISLIYLNDLFNLKQLSDSGKEKFMLRSFNKSSMDEKLHIIIISFNKKDIGFVVNKLLQQKEIVEKPLCKPLREVKFISGATILGNGNVCLVLDAPAIVNFLFKGSKPSTHQSQFAAETNY
ncbi:chemotaxis protein CheA [Rhodocytophaga aerolata]|uniref:Chemotaxis protein CheA n=1 Tax=Rhodocytophaga aerolata TaxID=455078 RepID=A0ABT8RGN8_9BACT|nr:chemotaxis protein CheA [Rhodocytophaga aerolata]MDO1451262.1 chemotaxis protein CheA [Rhodocytophaga aerolata]